MPSRMRGGAKQEEKGYAMSTTHPDEEEIETLKLLCGLLRLAARQVGAFWRRGNLPCPFAVGGVAPLRFYSRQRNGEAFHWDGRRRGRRRRSIFGIGDGITWSAIVGESAVVTRLGWGQILGAWPRRIG